jgi:heterotetrameric sarcosine oxidase delta subunit
MLIPCPHCGLRSDAEFRYGGAAGIAYPEDPDSLDDARWSEFLYVRPNPLGPLRERWAHVAGCRRWFEIVRHTGTNELIGYPRLPGCGA